MLAPRALNTTKNPINFCSTYLSPVPNIASIKMAEKTEIAVECSVLDIGFSFDVGCSMLDVRCSSFK